MVCDPVTIALSNIIPMGGEGVQTMVETWMASTPSLVACFLYIDSRTDIRICHNINNNGNHFIPANHNNSAPDCHYLGDHQEENHISIHASDCSLLNIDYITSLIDITGSE